MAADRAATLSLESGRWVYVVMCGDVGEAWPYMAVVMVDGVEAGRRCGATEEEAVRLALEGASDVWTAEEILAREG